MMSWLSRMESRLVAGIFVCLLGTLTGCSHSRESSSGPPISVQDRRMTPPIYPALNGTVESFAALAYDNPVVVRGWGLVAGLPDTGSGEMPPEIRSLLMDRLLKNGVGFLTQGTGQYDPQKILSSRQVAAVFVEGAIPPLATRGTTFDLYLRALPNTQTTNLENGLLWPVNLRVHISAALQTNPIAKGRGPVFCNPFNSTGVALHKANAIVRHGRVLGGGVVMRSDPVILELYHPSYRIAALVERIINQRYGSYPAAATAENDLVIKIRVPRRFRRNPRYFVNLLMHLYLQQNAPGFTRRQAGVLIHALDDPNAPRREIAIALQQLGRTIIPILRRYYGAKQQAVRYYCLQAGTLLGDEDAVQRIIPIATDKASPFQLAAIHALERCKDRINATLAFTRLLASPEASMRLLAYRALRKIHSRTILSQTIAGKFSLDVLPCDSPPLLYATTTGRQRLALIGRIASLPPGSLYVSPHDTITVNYPLAAAPRAGDAKFHDGKPPVQLYYRDPLTNHAVEITCGPSLPNIITALGSAPNPFSPDYNPRKQYIALSYQRLLVMLYQMVQTNQIQASFRLQKMIPNQLAQVTTLNRPRPSRSLLGRSNVSTTEPAAVSPYNTNLPGEIPNKTHP